MQLSYVSLFLTALLRAASAADQREPRAARPPETLVTIIKPTAVTKFPPITTHTYKPCGGYRVTPLKCDEGEICIDDPYNTSSCGLACDLPGICVKPIMCGGIAGFRCPDGKKCFDDPRDDCDPLKGGADCAGLCI